MPARRNLKPRPRDHLAADGTWPEGPLEDDAPDEAAFVMEIAYRLRTHCEGRSIRSVARATGLHPQTIINILNGTTWGGVPTIYRLEKSLKIRLWDRRHLPNPPPPRRGTPNK